MGSTKTYLVLPKKLNVEGVNWPAGPRMIVDEGWTRMLRAAGARVITEAEYEALINPKPRAADAEKADTKEAPSKPPVEPVLPVNAAEEATSGEDDAGDSGRDQGPALDPVHRYRPRRPDRRVS